MAFPRILVVAALAALAACSSDVDLGAAGERAADRAQERSFGTRNNP